MGIKTQNALYCITASLGETQETSDLFASSWIGKISPLYWRIPILIWATLVTIFSIANFWGPTEKFLLYMTHWGLVFVVLESVFGILVVIKEMTGSEEEEEEEDATFGLPWYVKTYWVLYNIAIPVAFLITVFYWAVLRRSVKKNVNFAPNPVIDFMIHGGNSIVMLVELLLSAHPSKLLHIMQPLYFAGVYVLFTIIYYFAGGVDPWGNPFVYPVMDWSKPEQTLLVVTITALFLAHMHLLVVAIASIRDLIARRWLGDDAGVYNDGFA